MTRPRVVFRSLAGQPEHDYNETEVLLVRGSVRVCLGRMLRLGGGAAWVAFPVGSRHSTCNYRRRVDALDALRARRTWPLCAESLRGEHHVHEGR